MSSRKSRLSLSSDVRKDVGGKTTCRTPARTTTATRNSDTKPNDESCEVSPSQGAEYSPVISLTQDNSFHAINGVSWKWNSPQRFHGQIRMKADARRTNHKPVLKHKLPETPTEAPKVATGFNKFISKLNLLMGKENISHLESPGLSVDSFEENYYHSEHHEQCDEGRAHSEDSDDDLFQEYFIDTAGDESGVQVDTVEGNPTESIEAFDNQLIGDELDDSKLDRILIEASQTVEQKLNNPLLPPPTVIHAETETNFSIPFEMNDSDMDGFLVQASLMVEEKLTDSSQDSNSNKTGAKVNEQGATAFPPSHTTYQSTDVERKSAQPNAVSSDEGSVEVTSETSMSQEGLKALLQKKRQEALQRLQNNRLKRAMKNTASNG